MLTLSQLDISRVPWAFAIWSSHGEKRSQRKGEKGEAEGERSQRIEEREAEEKR